MEIKRVTLKVTQKQHKFLKDHAGNGITQEDLLGLMIDVLSANPKTFLPHVERLRKRKAIEAERQKELDRKAKNLLQSLSDEQIEKLLAGQLSQSI